MIAELQQRADAALAAGNVAEARARLEEAAALPAAGYELWMRLAPLRRRLGDAAGALAAVNAALDDRANDFLALLVKASLHEQQGDRAFAAECYGAACHNAPPEAGLPPPLRAQLARARAFVSDHAAAVRTTVSRGLDVDPPHRFRADRFVENVISHRPAYHQEPTHYRYPGLADIEYFDFAYPALRERLRAAFPAIKAEFAALFARHPDRQRPYVDFASGQPAAQWEPLNRSPKWNALHLMRYGELDPVNAAACPQTMAAIAGDDRPDVAGVAPNAMFSLLAPHTRIPPHHGVANFRSVLHLPLIVPQGCAFRVGADTRAWSEGEPWVFDDTIEHEAWNESDALRVILLIDVWRPELDAADRAIVRQFFAAQAAAPGLGAL